MSDQVPTFLSTSHVVVPLSLFKAMSLCYFGTGPRLNEPAPLPSSPVPQSTGSGMGGVPTMPTPSTSWKLKPMGAAAPQKKEGPANEPRIEQPPKG